MERFEANTLCQHSQAISTLYRSVGTYVRICKLCYAVSSNIQSKGVFTGMEVIDKIEQVFSSDDANYFILEQIHTLPTMIEALPRKPPELQVCQSFITSLSNETFLVSST